MKKILLLILFSPILIFAQFTDDFDDGNFEDIPSWHGDTNNFIVDNTLQLRLNDNEAGISKLYTASTIYENGLWKFRIELDFNPSSSNYCRIFLASSNNEFQNSESIYLDIGKSSDRIDLYYFDGENKAIILSSEDAILNKTSIQLDILVEKIGSNWSLKTKEFNEKTYNLISGSNYEVPNFKSTVFGIETHYTKTRSTKFYFDNFDVTEIIIPDNTPPKIYNIEILDANKSIVVFNEKVMPITSNNLDVGAGVFIDEISTTDSLSYVVYYSNSLLSGTKYYFNINNVSDLSGNILKNYSCEKLFYRPKENDIVINEIMFNPSPRVNLPEAEYIEFFNNTDGIVLMKDWILSISGKTYFIPEISLLAGEYFIVLSDVDSSLFNETNKVELSFSSLSNSGSTLMLKSAKGDLINQIAYSPEMFSNNIKKDGGWSLELINPKNDCIKKENWTGSLNENGGSPGKKNSVLDSSFYPEIDNQIYKVVTNDDVTQISVGFTNYIDANNVSIDTDYSGDVQISYDNYADGSSEIELFLLGSKVINPVYFYFKNLKNCEGVIVESDTILVANYQKIEKGDVVINEVMFDPKKGSNDFIELYNNSDKYISLRNFYLSNFYNDNEESIIENIKKISEENVVFAPRTYFVFTKSSELISSNYTCSNKSRFIEMSSLPKISNDGGSIALLDNSLNIIDKMVYSDDMHVNLMKDEKRKGISIERIRASIPSLDFSNWTSASQSSGGATPGLKNSSTPSDVYSQEIFEVFPKVFTPNNDGLNDVVELKFNIDKPGFIANVKVFNSNGIMIKEVANNYLIGTEGSFIWNGTDDNNKYMFPGIYVFLVEIFDVDGRYRVFKKVIVLG